MASLQILDLQMSAELAAIITDLTCELIVPTLQPLLMQELRGVHSSAQVLELAGFIKPRE